MLSKTKGKLLIKLTVGGSEFRAVCHDELGAICYSLGENLVSGVRLGEEYNPCSPFEVLHPPSKLTNQIR